MAQQRFIQVVPATKGPGKHGSPMQKLLAEIARTMPPSIITGNDRVTRSCAGSVMSGYVLNQCCESNTLPVQDRLSRELLRSKDAERWWQKVEELPSGSLLIINPKTLERFTGQVVKPNTVMRLDPGTRRLVT